MLKRKARDSPSDDELDKDYSGGEDVSVAASVTGDLDHQDQGNFSEHSDSRSRTVSRKHPVPKKRRKVKTEARSTSVTRPLSRERRHNRRAEASASAPPPKSSKTFIAKPVCHFSFLLIFNLNNFDISRVKLNAPTSSLLH